jgi:hypothetical protein
MYGILASYWIGNELYHYRENREEIFFKVYDFLTWRNRKFGKLGVDWRIVLRIFLKKFCVKMCMWFISLMTGSSGGLLWTQQEPLLPWLKAGDVSTM